MNIPKFSRPFLSLLAVPLFTGLTLLPIAPATSVTFQPKGSPDRTAGGASRGLCSPAGVTSLGQGPKGAIAALIPATDTELTAAAYPTVLVKIPEFKSVQAEFVLWDENSNGIYQTTITLNDKPGIVSFKVPSSVEPLAIGKRYQWSVALICDPANRQRDIVVGGWLQRADVNPNLRSQLEGADLLQQTRLYAQNGFWYDTVATLAELKRSRPDDTSIAAEWQELLQSVGLAELSQIPLANCCQAQS